MSDARLIAGWLAELAVFGLLLRRSLQRIGIPALLTLAAGSFVLRVVTSGVLYLISSLGLPILPELQVPGGYWRFALDAVNYDHEAKAIAAYLGGTSGPVPVLELWSWFAGVVYWIFGHTQLHALLLNAVLAVACIPLAFVAARWSGLETCSALVAAGLVALWPSSFAWSSQLLTDPLLWVGQLALVAGGAGLLALHPVEDTRGMLISAAPCALLVAIGIHILAANSLQQAVANAVVILIGVAIWLVRQFRPFARRRATMAAALLTLALVSGIASRSLWRSLLSRPPVRPVRAEASCEPARGLLNMREAYLQAGGATLIDPQVRLNTCLDVVRYVPRALSLIFVEPLPSRWTPGVSVGRVRYFSALDAVVLWLLAPGLVWGILRAFRRPDGGAGMIATMILLVGLAMGLAVANFGTLFRLRLQVLLPATILAVDGWSALWTGWACRIRPHRVA